jgi:serine/threonine protein kinase
MLGLDFLRSVGEAVYAKGLAGLLREVPFGELLQEIAGEAFKRWQERRREAAHLAREAELRAEIEALARQSAGEARAAAAQVAREVAGGQPGGVELALELYLSQVPAAIRRSLVRADDPTGTTVPAGAAVGRPGDLVPLLPSKLPRFRSGERPACLDGRWELVELLGTGGFGEVWKGRHVDSPALVSAFKFCLDTGAQDLLLRHEAAVLTQVQKHGKHPGVVPLEDFDLRGETPWLRYEFVDGGDLLRVVAELAPRTVAERCAGVVPLLRRLAESVGHFHRLTPPVVHRDLKPTNVLVNRSASGEWVCRVADFGIGNVAAHPAGLPGGSTPGVSGMLTLGGAYTAGYASPQQRKRLPPDPRDDVYALGAIAYQLLLADPTAEAGPDAADELTALGVPGQLVRVVTDCVAHNAAKRPKDGAELAERIALPVPDAEVVSPVPDAARGRRGAVANTPPPVPKPSPEQSRAARDRLVRALFQLHQDYRSVMRPDEARFVVPGVIVLVVSTILLVSGWIDATHKGRSVLAPALVGGGGQLVGVTLIPWGVWRFLRRRRRALRTVADEIGTAVALDPAIKIVLPDEPDFKIVQHFGWEAVHGLEAAAAGTPTRVTVQFPTGAWLFANPRGGFKVLFDERLLGEANLSSGIRFELAAPAGVHVMRLAGSAECIFLVEVPTGEGCTIEVPRNAFASRKVEVYRT